MSDPDGLTVAVDAFPEATALLDLATTAVKAGMEYQEFMNTPAMQSAQTEQNRLDAQAAFNAALKANSVAAVQEGMADAQSE